MLRRALHLQQPSTRYCQPAWLQGVRKATSGVRTKVGHSRSNNCLCVRISKPAAQCCTQEDMLRAGEPSVAYEAKGVERGE
jgi:hypothetical protein